MSRGPKSVKSLSRVWPCVGLIFSVNGGCIASYLTLENTAITVYSINYCKTWTMHNTDNSNWNCTEIAASNLKMRNT